MKIPASYFAYFGIAVLIGLIFSFGIAGVTHQPLPVQVQLNQYQPAPAPAPAIPTIAPKVASTDKFAPAPAPVVVTTAPLPTITPEPTLSTLMCDVNSGGIATSYACVFSEIASLVVGIVPILFILVAVGMAFSIFGMINRR